MTRGLAMITLATISAGCLSQTVPPGSGAGAVGTALPPFRLQAATLGATDPRGEIETLLGSAEWSVMPTGAERVQLKALYQRQGNLPLWTDVLTGPTRQARAALALLEAAADEGLDPGDYDAAALAARAAAWDGWSVAELARFDIGMSAGLLRYLRHLHAGRIDPRAIGFRLRAPTDEHDYGALLGAAIAADRVPDTAAALRPQLWAYESLCAALRRYRTLAADATLTAPPPPAKTIHPGDPYADAPVLRRLLMALDDLAAGETIFTDTAAYDDVLVSGVKRFQIRHGLDADGVLGAATIAALRTPLEWRVRQIELALERLRWLPHDDHERLVLVNVPMFRLWAWDEMAPRGTPALATDVIVGRALSTQTPVFVEDLREVIFRPYWNVPASILRNEILPQIRRDPSYLQKHDMEVVAPDGHVVDTAGNVARVGRGGYGVRQRPGYRNALGLVKFVFPNQENVYMHDTPAQELFSRSRRDFSHGCVRVRDPVGLAEWALAGVADWNRERILSAMTGTRTVHVDVARSTRVVLFYATAIIAPEDGTLRFANDLYGHDGRLDRAVASARAVE
jgi:murein L,D-transpeptidase YcbB/YkuD